MSKDRKPDTITEWGYAATIERTGGVIYGVTHDSETFLEKAGLIRSYTELKNSVGSTFVPFDLGTEGMKVGETMKILPQPARSPDYYYQLSHKVYAPFEIRSLAGSGQRIRGQQMFAFTEASNTPRHETLGVASAGRFYPTINFEIPPGGGDLDEVIETLRFDFWLEPDLAAGGKRNPSVLGLHPSIFGFEQLLAILFPVDLSQKTPQQAGLFRDRDHGLLIRPFAVGGLGTSGEQVFSGAEKPLLWEVAANGMLDGGTLGWDNIHVWGFHPDGLVSTPGMPFGLHLHWRWAAAITNGASMLLGKFTPDFLRAPELAGRDIAGNMVPGGPLIDPRTPRTDLRIAVVSKDVAETYAGVTATTDDDFFDIFSDISPDPADIAAGAEIVVIVSIVQRRPDRRSTWKSSVFPHGLFFPHAYDVGMLAEAALLGAGAYDQQYISRRPRRSWRRDPI